VIPFGGRIITRHGKRQSAKPRCFEMDDCAPQVRWGATSLSLTVYIHEREHFLSQRYLDIKRASHSYSHRHKS